MARVKRHALLTLFLIAPIACFALLIWWIFASFAKGPEMDVRGIGQGAGDAGGANAIGELLAARREAEEADTQSGLGADTQPNPEVSFDSSESQVSEPQATPLGVVPGLSGQGLSLTVVGGPAGPEASREVWIWIPPGVDLSSISDDARLAMLYVLDGQTAIAPTIESEGREFHLDEIAGSLVADAKAEPMLIVAVPFLDGESWTVGPEALGWVTGALVEQVERGVGVRSEMASRGIMGGGVAGAIALDAALRRTDLFGRVIAFDPALNAVLEPMAEVARQAQRPVQSVWIMDSADDARSTPTSAEILIEAILESGLVRDRRVRFSPVAEPIITPDVWAERMRDAIAHTYPG